MRTWCEVRNFASQ